MDIFEPSKRSEIMSKIRSKNTKPEIVLRKALFAQGLRYRIHYKKLPGNPDIVFTKYNVAIFIDGDWWHGRHFLTESRRYPEKWQIKIEKNMLRDKKVNMDLSALGWKVIRLWGSDVLKDTENCIFVIKQYLV